MKKYFILSFVAVCLALVSCQKQRLAEGFGSQTNEIALKGATVPTKSAIEGTVFPVGYSMLVSAYRNPAKTTDPTVGYGDVASNYFENILFKNEGGVTWLPATTKYWPLNGTLDFLCIASAGLRNTATGVVPDCAWGDNIGAANNNVAKKVVATIPNNSGKFDDILYGSSNEQTFVASGTPIDFKHAMCAVVFFAKSSNEPYDDDLNLGITLTAITVNSPTTSGTLTVENPKAGRGSGNMTASWTLGSDIPTTLSARKWNPNGNGIDPAEPAFNFLHLTDKFSDNALNTPGPTYTDIVTYPFGDAYVILPPQTPKSFTISYTLHNGYKDDGSTRLSHNLSYTYTPDVSQEWAMGKKVIYMIDITLDRIEIAPKVIDWIDDFREEEI